MERLTLEDAINHAKEAAKASRTEAEYHIPTTGPYYNADLELARQYEQIALWLEELKSYKTLEEHGLLVRLPDDLSKEVYRITYEYTECSEYGEKNIDCENYNCKCECDSKKNFYIVKNSLRFMLFCNYYDELGKTVFLTREEAEKKLEEMKNERI